MSGGGMRDKSQEYGDEKEWQSWKLLCTYNPHTEGGSNAVHILHRCTSVDFSGTWSSLEYLFSYFYSLHFNTNIFIFIVLVLIHLRGVISCCFFFVLNVRQKHSRSGSFAQKWPVEMSFTDKYKYFHALSTFQSLYFLTFTCVKNLNQFFNFDQSPASE